MDTGQHKPPKQLLLTDLWHPVKGMKHAPKKPVSLPESDLLGIAAEIRLMIYRLTACTSKEIQIADLPVYIKEPPLLAVSKQIRSEALPVFYGENTFWLRYEARLQRFAQEFDPFRLAMVKKVCYEYYQSLPQARKILKRGAEKCQGSKLGATAFHVRVYVWEEKSLSSEWIWANLESVKGIREVRLVKGRVLANVLVDKNFSEFFKGTDEEVVKVQCDQAGFEQLAAAAEDLGMYYHRIED